MSAVWLFSALLRKPVIDIQQADDHHAAKRKISQPTDSLDLGSNVERSRWAARPSQVSAIMSS